MTIDTGKLKFSTKGLLGLVGVIATLMQIPQVNAVVTKVLVAHPRLAPLATCFAVGFALLHDPQVQQALGMKTTTEVKQTTEEITVAKPGDTSAD